MNTLRIKRKFHHPVTIAIGILSNDSIQIASDSQTTLGHFKSQDAEKIHIVDLKDAQILVAEAGHAHTSQRLIEIIQEFGQHVSITNYRTVADLACEAVVKLKQEMQKAQLGCNRIELAEFVEQNELDCALLIAHYHNGEPFIYLVDFNLGSANTVACSYGKHFAVMGSGADLATYLMREFSRPKMEFNPAFATMVYAVGEVKKHDSHCSGLTRFGFIGDDNKASILKQEIVTDIADKIEHNTQQAVKSRNKALTDMLEEVAKTMAKKYPL